MYETDETLAKNRSIIPIYLSPANQRVRRVRICLEFLQSLQLPHCICALLTWLAVVDLATTRNVLKMYLNIYIYMKQ